jgi:hypothetical protein
MASKAPKTRVCHITRMNLAKMQLLQHAGGSVPEDATLEEEEDN